MGGGVPTADLHDDYLQQPTHQSANLKPAKIVMIDAGFLFRVPVDRRLRRGAGPFAVSLLLDGSARCCLLRLLAGGLLARLLRALLRRRCATQLLGDGVRFLCGAPRVFAFGVLLDLLVAQLHAHGRGLDVELLGQIRHAVLHFLCHVASPSGG